MNKVRLILTSVISIILVSVLMIGSTYSIFTTSDVDEELNVYTTGNLDITYTVSSEEVTLSDSLPTNIADANTIVPYRITVTNKGMVPYMFDLSLEDITSSDVIDYQYIMTKVGSLEPKSLSSCTDNIIKEDIILPAGESVDIDVRVWISDEIQNTELNKSFFAKITVEEIAIYDKHTNIDHSILELSIAYMKTLFPNNDGIYYKSTTYREKIKTAVFVDYIDTTNAVVSWDVSEDQDGSIMCWLSDNETEGYYDLYFGSESIIFAKDLSYLFSGLTYMDSISFDNLDTSLTTNMTYMFDDTGYSSTEFTLDLGEKFDTSNVTTMGSMFYRTGYTSTEFTLDLGEKFDTSNVTTMSNMFSSTGYSSTEFTLDLGEKFDTSNVTTMGSMFYRTGYTSTEFTLDLGEKFDTSNVTNMKNMFYQTGYSSTIFTLDLGEKFDTSNVTNMSSMFSRTGYKSTVFTLDLGDHFNTSNVTEMNAMFQGLGYISSVLTLDLGENFDTSNVTDMSWMFNQTGYNSTVFTLDFGKYFNTSKVEDMYYMFFCTGYANSNLELDLSTFDFSAVTSYDSMFDGFSSTKKIYVRDEADQTWILEKEFSNLSTSNVLIKS